MSYFTRTPTCICVHIIGLTVKYLFKQQCFKHRLHRKLNAQFVTNGIAAKEMVRFMCHDSVSYCKHISQFYCERLFYVDKFQPWRLCIVV
jgi:hypothetical protein